MQFRRRRFRQRRPEAAAAAATEAAERERIPSSFLPPSVSYYFYYPPSDAASPPPPPPASKRGGRGRRRPQCSLVHGRVHNCKEGERKGARQEEDKDGQSLKREKELAGIGDISSGSYQGLLPLPPVSSLAC